MSTKTDKRVVEALRTLALDMGLIDDAESAGRINYMQKLQATITLSVRNFLRETDYPKPLQEWTVEEMIMVIEGAPRAPGSIFSDTKRHGH